MDFFRLTEKRNLTAEKILKATKANNHSMNMEKAKELLSIIYALANLAVKIELRRSNEKSYSKVKTKK